MATAGTGWAQLRQQTRANETQTEQLFHTYSQFSAPSTVSSTASETEAQTESQIRDLLTKRQDLIGQLSRLLDSESALTSSALKQSNLARHREVLQEHEKELERIHKSITGARERANLMDSVRTDMEQYRRQEPGAEEADYMLDERRRLDEAHRQTDGVLSQAYEINESFSFQRETLSSINRRITTAASHIPGINTVMQRISSKKRRDAIILASFIAFCFLMLLWFR